MRKIVVRGGAELTGEVAVGGSKNAALPILFAGIVTEETCVFYNLPRVSDVLRALEILHFLGARIAFEKSGEVSVDYAPVTPKTPPAALTSSIRGSVYLLGAMLARFGEAALAGAGGCDFGVRPIDQHLFGFGKLGATEERAEGVLRLRAEEGLCGARIRLAMPSVGASANLLIAASRAAGRTVIENAAAEPHIAALAAFLSAAGAHIEGVGTSTLTVIGVPRLHGARVTIIPDMIEAGTYLALGVACGGRVRVRGVCPAHLTALTDAFSEMGVGVEIGKDTIAVSAPEGYRGIDVETGPYPAFPTDLHPQMAALFCLGGRAGSKGSVTENVWESRFRYTEELRRMGARIDVEDRRAVFYPSALTSAKIKAPDLRGGAALLIAALSTRGIFEIDNAGAVARGYEHLESKLRGIGARVQIY